MSSITQKIKDAIHPSSSEPEGTHGHHNTRAANAADPRIDSDRDNRANPTTTGFTSGAPEGTHGPHGRVGNTVDPRIDSDRDNRAAGGFTTGDNYTHGATGTSHTTGTGLTGSHTAGTGSHTSTAGPHNSNLLNKADPRVDSDRDGRGIGHGTNTTGTHTTGTHTTGAHPTGSHATTTSGPHNSNLLNKADPRVDSDRDGGRLGNTAGDYRGSGPEGVAGPHQSRMANAADPRVDSDRDGSRTAGNTYGSSGTATGAYPTGTHTAGHGTHTTGTHTTGTGIGGTHTGAHTGGSHATTTSGPHNSNLLNKADPRVDSDRDGGRLGNTAGDHHRSGPEGVAGPHQSRMANAADPRVDSDRDGSRTAGNTYGSSGTATGTHTAGHGTHTTGTGIGGTHTGTHTTGTHATGTHPTGTHGPTTTGAHTATVGSGHAKNTAGPHKSDLLNKLDPRVDSNLDGSKTIGGDKTYS